MHFQSPGLARYGSAFLAREKLNMRVLLIEPPPNPDWMLYPHTPWVGVWMPNTGLVRVATAAKSAGHEVKVAEIWAQKISSRGLRRMIEEFRPDVVGSTAITATLYYAMSYLKLAKRINPAITTVLGGVHPTMAPEECLRGCGELDYVVVGEGELTIVELLDRIEQGWNKEQMRGVRGTAFMQEGKFVRTPDRPLMENLDDLPMPAFELFSVGSRRYRFPNIGPLFLRSPAWGVEYTRGCEFACRFCVKPILWRQTLRYRSESKVCDELEVLTRKYGIKSGQLFSNDIFARRDRLENLIIEMEKRKLSYRFVTFGRADTIVANRDLVPKLVKVGLVMLWIGVESLEQDVLDHISKGTTKHVNREAVKIAVDAGVPVVGPFFIVGFPEHTIESMRAMKREALSLAPRFSPALPAFSPTPGTPMYEEVAREGLIVNFDYSQWDVGGAICSTRTMTPKQVNLESRKFGMKCVFRPSFWLSQLALSDVHAKFQAFLGLGIMMNTITKLLLRLCRLVGRKVRALLGRPVELDLLFDEVRNSMIAVTKARAQGLLRAGSRPPSGQQSTTREN